MAHGHPGAPHGTPDSLPGLPAGAQPGDRNHVSAPLLRGSAGNWFRFPNSWRFLVPGEGLELSCLKHVLKPLTDGHRAQTAISRGPVGLRQKRHNFSMCSSPGFPCSFWDTEMCLLQGWETRSDSAVRYRGWIWERTPASRPAAAEQTPACYSPPSVLLRQETHFLMLVKTFPIGTQMILNPQADHKAYIF